MMAAQNPESTAKNRRRALASWLGIPEGNLRAALNDATWAGLRSTAFGLACLFGLSGLFLSLTFARYARLPLLVLNPLVALALLTTAVLLKRIPPRPSAAPAIGAAMMILVTASILFQMGFSHNLQWTVMIMLIIVASGAVILTVYWLFLIFLAAWIGWLAVVLMLFPRGQT